MLTWRCYNYCYRLVATILTYALIHHTMHSCKLANEGTRPSILLLAGKYQWGVVTVRIKRHSFAKRASSSLLILPQAHPSFFFVLFIYIFFLKLSVMSVFLCYSSISLTLHPSSHLSLCADFDQWRHSVRNTSNLKAVCKFPAFMHNNLL